MIISIANYVKYNYFCDGDGIHYVMLRLWMFSDFSLSVSIAGDVIMYHSLVFLVSAFTSLMNLVLFSGYYWIGLAQLEDNKQHWIDGSQYTGSAISGRGNKCIKAGIAVGGVQWKADNCNSIYPCICEEVAPPGKGIYHVFGGSFGVWAQSMRGDVILRRLLSLAKPIPRLIPGYQQSLSVSPWLANAPVSSIFPLFLQPSVAPWKTSVNVKDNLYSYFTMILHPH